MKILGYVKLNCGSYRVYVLDNNLLKPIYYSQSYSVKNEETVYLKLIEDNLALMKRYDSFHSLKLCFNLYYMGCCDDITIEDFPDIIFDQYGHSQYHMYNMGGRELSDSEITRLTLLNASFRLLALQIEKFDLY